MELLQYVHKGFRHAHCTVPCNSQTLIHHRIKPNMKWQAVGHVTNLVKSSLHCNENVIILTTYSSPAAAEVIWEITFRFDLSLVAVQKRYNDPIGNADIIFSNHIRRWSVNQTSISSIDIIFPGQQSPAAVLDP